MVLANKKSRKSARKLKAALLENDYDGKSINFGCSELKHDYGEIINSAEAVANAVNKELALTLLKEADLPTPLISEDEARDLLEDNIKVIGRTKFHSKGRGFYMIATTKGIDYAKRKGATHFVKFIEDALEFRVHVVNGQSIKISQKVFPEGLAANRRNHRFGATFEYPEDFNHKKTLRTICKKAVEVLGLDFGAVDVLYKDDKYYILEVNTAPCLTDENSDTLERYVQAFQAFVND